MGFLSHSASAAFGAGVGAALAPGMRRHIHKPPSRPSHINPYEHSMIELADDIVMAIRDAFVRANAALSNYGIRYEIMGEFPVLKGLTTRAPDITLLIQLRDIQHPRRQTQSTSIRISMRRSAGTISVSILDPKLRMTPKKVIFHREIRDRDYQLKNYENKLAPKLIDRGLEAFRRDYAGG